MDFIETDKKDTFRKKEFTINPFEKEIVGKQLVDSFNNIKNHIFSPGCEDEKCKWCNFVQRNMPVLLNESSEDDPQTEFEQ